MSNICYVLFIFGIIVKREVNFMLDLFDFEVLWKVLESVS